MNNKNDKFEMPTSSSGVVETTAESLVQLMTAIARGVKAMVNKAISKQRQ